MHVERVRFSMLWAARHAVVSLLVALGSAALVFGLWYPMPYRAMQGVGSIYLLILVVDVVCGPLLTLVMATPKKSRRELFFDLGIIGLIQVAALLYGMHAVWIARPVVLAFESDRLVVVTANEIDKSGLSKAPEGLRQLKNTGVLEVATRQHRSNAELLEGIDRSMAGDSPAMRPDWWEPMSQHLNEMRAKARPLSELTARKPQHADLLKGAAAKTGTESTLLWYLPLTSSRTKDWIALLDAQMKVVGYAQVDGF